MVCQSYGVAAADPGHPADGDAEVSGPHLWLPEIAQHVASFLPPNYVACTVRALDKASSEQFSDMTAVLLSQPAPAWAFAEHWLAPGSCRSLNLERRQKLLGLVAASGHVSNLQTALRAAGCKPDDEVLAAAARAGAVDCCKHLVEAVKLPAESGLCAAAEGGHGALCTWLLANGAKRSWEAVAEAYRSGHVELAQRLIPSSRPDEGEAMGVLEAAARGCDLAVLQRLYRWAGRKVSAAEDYLRAIPLAAAIGSPTPDWEAKAGFLLAKGCSLYDSSADYLIQLPLDVARQRLDWIEDQDYPLDDLALDAVLSVGNAESLGLMLDAGASGFERWVYREPNGWAGRQLVEAGQMEPEQAVGCTVKAGAEGLPVLRWLLETYGEEILDPESEHVDDHSSWFFDDAAKTGSVEVMELLLSLENAESYGLQLSSSTWADVAESGCVAALEWLAQRGCPKPDDAQPYLTAICNGDAHTLRALRQLGLPWDMHRGTATLSHAAANGLGLDSLRWLVAEGWPVNWEAEKAAAEERVREGKPGAAELLAWMEEASASKQRRSPRLQARKGPGASAGQQREEGGRGGKRQKRGGK